MLESQVRWSLWERSNREIADGRAGAADAKYCPGAWRRYQATRKGGFCFVLFLLWIGLRLAVTGNEMEEVSTLDQELIT